MKSYGKIYNVGHLYVRNIFDYDVVVEEKLDGSQFSFWLDEDGELKVKSKNVLLNKSCPPNMFVEAVLVCENFKDKMTPGYIYRAEYLQKEKHNTLKYNSIPNKHLCLFDVDKGEQYYMTWEEKKEEAEKLGIDVVPKIFEGKIDNINQVKEFLSRKSYLGGSLIEGVVIKAYGHFNDRDGKTLMAKYVSESFKETNHKTHKVTNNKDIKQKIIDYLSNSHRYEKAFQHLRDEGKITYELKDIAHLVQEVQKDIREECMDDIARMLVAWALKDILRGATREVPNWYKEKLLQLSLEKDNIKKEILAIPDLMSYFTVEEHWERQKDGTLIRVDQDYKESNNNNDH